MAKEPTNRVLAAAPAAAPRYGFVDPCRRAQLELVALIDDDDPKPSDELRKLAEDYARDVAKGLITSSR